MSFDSLKIRRTLAADQRFGELDLPNDQVWELVSNDDPAAVTMRTSFGLRCGGLRIFPQFTLQGITLTDPHTFANPVNLLKRRSNYVLLEFAPFTQLNVQLELWVPSSQVLCGRIKLTNRGTTAMNFAVNWSVVLDPLDQGEHISTAQMGVNTVLQGRNGELHPVFFLTGGPEPLERAYPSLEVKMILAGGASRKLSWALATLDSTEASFSLARQSTSLAWDVRNINAEMLDKATAVEFIGDDETELLNETQTKARQFLVPTKANSNLSTFVTRRQPDGRNFVPISSRQELISFSQINSYDAWMLSRILLPANPQPLKEIVQYFLDFQQDDGSIPWAINARGTASSAKMAPLLAGIVCDIYPSIDDRDWLRQVYFPLLNSLKTWFNPSTDTIPTWENSLQTGLDNHPLYEYGDGYGLGMEPELIHSPALDALFFHECTSLMNIARLLGESADLEWLEKTTQQVAEALDACWDADKYCHTYRDIQTGEVFQRETIHEIKHNGRIKLVRKFNTPRRLTIVVPGQAALSGSIHVTIAGKNSGTDVSEDIIIRSRYTNQQIVTRKLFDRLDLVEINDLPGKNTLTLGIAGNDCEDITLLLPLWSGAMSQEKVDLLIEKTLLPRYLCPSGLLTQPVDQVPLDKNLITPFWNHLIIEGLNRCNRRDIAGKIQNNLLHAQMKQWQKNGYVSSGFLAQNLMSKGELDTLSGLPSIYTLMQTMGIDRIVEKELFLNGLNEFLPSFTVKYKGTSIEMKSDQTNICTLRDETIEIKEKGSCKVVLP